MIDRADALRRLIALYRRYMAEGADTDLAWQYLHEIATAEAELGCIENGTNKRR
jgi:hypothetical protein